MERRSSCTAYVRTCEPDETPAPGLCRDSSLAQPTLRISPHNWLTSIFNVWVAAMLLSEQLQIPTKVVEYPSSAGCAGMGMASDWNSDCQS